MTEENVRVVFYKNFSGYGGDLNETLMASWEEVALGLLTKQIEAGETLPDIIRTMVRALTRLGLFMAMFSGEQTQYGVPVSYLFYFDYVRKAMLDAVNYMHDNYNTVRPWFRERFLKEHLKSMSADISQAIEMPTGTPAHTRGLNFQELKLEEEFFNSALIGILGVERFQKYAEEYNRCNKVLRQCQVECKMLMTPANIKES